jgi:hypothetical protein
VAGQTLTILLRKLTFKLPNAIQTYRHNFAICEKYRSEYFSESRFSCPPTCDCEDNPGRDGKRDFILKALNNKLWVFAGGRELVSPRPQDNDV